MHQVGFNYIDISRCTVKKNIKNSFKAPYRCMHRSYVASGCERDSLDKIGKISELGTCMISEIQKSLVWLPIQYFALLLLLVVGNLEVEQCNDLQWYGLRSQLCRDRQLLKKLLGRQIYEDTNTVSLPLVCTESKLIMLLNDASVCTERKNFGIRQVKKDRKGNTEAYYVGISNWNVNGVRNLTGLF